MSRTFMEAYSQALAEATLKVKEHDEDGENQVVPIEQMFPHGPQDGLFVVWMKVGRALGYERAHNIEKVREELVDIINYAAFTMAIIDHWREGNTDEHRSDSPISASRIGSSY